MCSVSEWYKSSSHTHFRKAFSIEQIFHDHQVYADSSTRLAAINNVFITSLLRRDMSVFDGIKTENLGKECRSLESKLECKAAINCFIHGLQW